MVITKIIRDKEFALRAKSLGALGELLAIKALVDNGFEKITNLNDSKKNFPFADLAAEKEGKRYLISVKARNKFQRNGTLNSRYKLGNNCYENAEKAMKNFNAEPYWLAIQIENNLSSAYLGSLQQLGGNKGIPMAAKHLENYVCLCKDKDHGLDFRPYQNLYKEDMQNG